MNYIILDLEWNQPLNAERTVQKPVCLHGEIIQIGAVMLDEALQVADTFKIMIQPKFYKKMHWSVSKLTRIKNIDLTQGVDFSTAMTQFRHFCGRDFVFMTWGPDDMGILRDNLLVHQLDTDWLPPCYDLQLLFDLQIGHKNSQIALEAAMEQLGEEILESHDALNDALNTARVCSYLELENALTNYAEMELEYLRQTSGADQVYQPEHPYDSLLSALEDSKLMEFRCPLCGESGTCSNVVKQNDNKYIGMGRCQNGDEFLARFKFAKRKDQKTDVTRFLYRMTDELRQYYTLKKEKAEKKRKQYLAYLARKKKKPKKSVHNS